uniref:Uncharacterized protein n=1 Tax=Rhizophora mucronata TaxID=61149 RepID=A0A2P2QTY8_RHIMU
MSIKVIQTVHGMTAFLTCQTAIRNHSMFFIGLVRIL